MVMVHLALGASENFTGPAVQVGVAVSESETEDLPTAAETGCPANPAKSAAS